MSDLTTRWIASVVLMLGGVLNVSLNLAAFLRQSDTQVSDFSRFHETARCLLDGCEPYLDPIRVPNFNPPIAHVLLLPLAWLSQPTAALLWTLAGWIIGGLCIWRIRRELEIRGGLALAMLIGVILTSGSMAHVTVQGQVSLVLLWPMTMAWVAARNDRWQMAAVWLGLLIALKPFVALFLVWLVLIKQSRAAIVATSVALGLTVVSVVIFGTHATAGWIWGLSQSIHTGSPDNGSIAEAVFRTFGPSNYYVPFVSAQWLIVPLTLVGLCAVAVAAAWSATRSTVDQGFTVTLLAALLLSPKGWAHYGLWLIGPLAAVIITSSRPWRFAIGLAVLAIPRPWRLSPDPEPLLTIALGSTIMWAYLALFTVTATEKQNR